MGQMKPPGLNFDVSPDAPVVTTTHVTQRGMPVLYVSHDLDSEGEISWQFHCGNDDFDSSVLQLVRLDEILELDGGLVELAGLPLGYCAVRKGIGSPWETRKEG